ncbi:SHOCT domain-containing protein [Cytophagaceae bacterium YF14B1]|uniref:SHOCT domain-containing protein n=1 Tax=Xanthocytophaga flava TaxID=3048013 RepID=A0AAE3QUM5_9BACT|nr:SHOCT domain-containing protein [Xanthocytophaga flavus]MDJ1485301.1 SHOCT domain-containing protein [Xanthocytophaga flavus]
MYNQFILEELKTLKDLLQAGAITQGEFDHLKQILIDGTKASNESTETGSQTERSLSGDVYENPDEVIRYYSNETKNLLLYKQFDKAYPFVQKILSLRPEHREANRFLQEIKTYIRRDYLIGGAIGVVIASAISMVLTLDKDINLILLCIIPVLGGLLLPRIASSILIGKVSSRGMRYFISAITVIVIGCVLNVALANVFDGLEGKLINGNSNEIVGPYEMVDTTNYAVLPNDTSQTLSEVGSEQIDTNNKTTSDKGWEKSTQNPDPIPQQPKEPQITVVEEGNPQTTAVRNILTSYYQDLSSQKFDANKYYAKKVKRFFNLQDISPQTITDEVHNNYYTDFQDAVSTIASNSLSIEPMKGGMYQADFKEVIKCFRKSANKGQTITSQVKVLFDKNMKIIYYSSRPLSTKEFGDRADEKSATKMVYYREDTNQ